MAISRDFATNCTKLTLGDVYLARKEYDASHHYYRHVLSLTQNIENAEYKAVCLEKLAALQWVQDNTDIKPVQWLATTATWRQQANIPLAPLDQAPLEQLLLAMKGQIAEQEFDVAWQTGASQSLAEALATAVNPPPT